jgi:polyferredoxin
VSLDLILWPLALSMATATAGLVKWAADARSRIAAGVVLFLLVMMSAMLLGAAVYASAPSAHSAVLGLWIAAALMSASVFPLFLLILRSVQPASAASAGTPPSAWKPTWAFTGSVVALVLGNELLMGWVFPTAAGTWLPVSGGGAGGLLLGFVQLVDGPWFLFPMALEMGLTVWLLRRSLPRPFVGLLLAQSALMFLSPPAFSRPVAITDAVILGSALMIGIIVFVMEYIYRHRQLEPALSSYYLGLLAAFAAMMAGLFVWLQYGSGLLFAGAVLSEMALYFGAVLRPARFSEGLSLPWQLRPNWTFGLLAVIFVGELFMGAVLDLVLLPGVYATAFPSLPLAGGFGTLLYNAFYNGFWFVALVCGSTWFLAMMGVEMGILVLYRFRETGSKENKVRLALVMGSYAAFATFFPSYYYSVLFPHAPSGIGVPVLGWSMGFGSAPVVPSLFLVIFLSYAITGSLTVLFGRRVICAVFCTPALMYSGTTFNAMSSFNRSSPLARKYLSSRFSTLYTASAGLAMGSLVAVSFLSYFDQTGAIAVTILGADPSVFFFSLCFGVLWYIIFVTIPYTGNYNCVTMGWCYTGQISAFFSRIGFFKLKVRDKQVCKECTTLDCAKACPVGLVDMPGHFRTKGEFRSSKCCGVGNCVGACPYGNLEFHDIGTGSGPGWGASVVIPRALRSRCSRPGPGSSCPRARCPRREPRLRASPVRTGRLQHESPH